MAPSSVTMRRSRLSPGAGPRWGRGGRGGRFAGAAARGVGVGRGATATFWTADVLTGRFLETAFFGAAFLTTVFVTEAFVAAAFGAFRFAAPVLRAVFLLAVLLRAGRLEAVRLTVLRLLAVFLTPPFLAAVFFTRLAWGLGFRERLDVPAAARRAGLRFAWLAVARLRGIGLLAAFFLAIARSFREP